MLHKVKQQKQEGFTIIEVLIVLAIAGLIMLVVFMAVPALQRNSRNTQKQSDVSNIVGAVQESINNNAGTLTTGTTPPAAVTAVKKTQITTINYNVVTSGANTLPGTIDADTVLIRNNLKCNSAYVPVTGTTTVATTVGTANTNVATTSGATNRSIVAIYAIENSGGLQPQCQEM